MIPFRIPRTCISGTTASKQAQHGNITVADPVFQGRARASEQQGSGLSYHLEVSGIWELTSTASSHKRSPQPPYDQILCSIRTIIMDELTVPWKEGIERIHLSSGSWMQRLQWNIHPVVPEVSWNHRLQAEEGSQRPEEEEQKSFWLWLQRKDKLWGKQGS